MAHYEGIEGEEPEELGIPGHAAHGGFARKLQSFLKAEGFRYEAEGDVTRIHLNGLILEVKDEPGRGVILMASLSLPTEAGQAALEAIAGFQKLFRVLGTLSGEIEYELDKSLPGYPMLRVVVAYANVESLVNDLIEALKLIKE